MNRDTYQRGKIAEILGISKDVLRYYEEKKLIQPLRNEHNGYRFYDDKDLPSLINLRMLRSYGFSIKQMESKECSIEDTSFINTMDDFIVEIDRDIRYLEKKRIALQKMKEKSIILQNKKMELEIKDASSSLWFIKQFASDIYTDEAQKKPILDAARDLLPISQYGLFLNDLSTWNGADDLVAFDSGIFIEECDLYLLKGNKEIELYAQNISFSNVCHFYMKSIEAPWINQEQLNQAIHFIEKKGYVVEGPCLFFLLPVTIGAKDCYFDCVIPIHKKSREGIYE